MQINDIKTRKYEGYIWLSDAETPKVLHDEEYSFSKHGELDNPFIVEALLYAKDENVSITIKHTGKYHIHEFDLKNLIEGAEIHNVGYLPHRLSGVSKVNFRQIWLPEADENCHNWPVLKMKALVFTGFEYKK
jgi:CRISPR type III-associated protein (TIGR04423 family)